jgi:hypothetical protein
VLGLEGGEGVEPAGVDVEDHQAGDGAGSYGDVAGGDVVPPGEELVGIVGGVVEPVPLAGAGAGVDGEPVAGQVLGVGTLAEGRSLAAGGTGEHTPPPSGQGQGVVDGSEVSHAAPCLEGGAPVVVRDGYRGDPVGGPADGDVGRAGAAAHDARQPYRVGHGVGGDAGTIVVVGLPVDLGPRRVRCAAGVALMGGHAASSPSSMARSRATGTTTRRSPSLMVGR